MAFGATQFGVRSFQRIAGFLRVIEAKIGTHDRPTLGNMTGAAIFGKFIVGDHQPQFLRARALFSE